MKNPLKQTRLEWATAVRYNDLASRYQLLAASYDSFPFWREVSFRPSIPVDFETNRAQSL
jgi:hypothetical protein